MKNLFKRVTSFITALAMTTTLTGGVQLVSFAEEEVFTAALTDEAYFSVDDFGLSDDELLLGYFENKLYGIDGGISTFAIPNTRSLTTKEKAAYDALKAAAIEIAKGDRASAEIDVVLTWTPSEAGVDAFSPENISNVFNSVTDTIDTGKVMSYLLADCPYEFYWFNKVAGMQIPVSMSTYTSTSLPITFKFQMSVGKEYADTADYTVKTSVTKSASAAATNANAIVTSNAGKSELERLTAYKDAICSLVSYDDEAVNHLNDSTYGVDPWQVIHVFDNDVNTEVVCEGYAKAFQYLCDLDGGLTCYSVTGTMSGGTGAGGHMWNIVTLGGKNYLVDVTNCDEGTVGASDKLFLKGMTEEAAAKTYSKTIGSQTITFTYYDGTKEGTSNMADLFGTDILTLSTTDYSETVCDAHIDDMTDGDALCDNCGTALEARLYCYTFDGSTTNEVSTVFYTTLDEAFENVGSDEYFYTLDNLSDATLTDDVDITALVDWNFNGYDVTVADGKSIAFSLSGSALHGASITGNVEGALVDGNIALEQDNNTITNANQNGYAVKSGSAGIGVNSTFSLNGGKADILIDSGKGICFNGPIEMGNTVVEFDVPAEAIENEIQITVASYIASNGDSYRPDIDNFTYVGNDSSYELVAEEIEGSNTDCYILFRKKAEAISIADAEVVQTNSLTFNGSAQTPEFEVKIDETTLTEDTDYTVTVTSQTNAGSDYEATITGIGEYDGEKTVTWTIAQAKPSIGNITTTPNRIYDSITAEDITLTYENSAAIPGTLTVNNGQTLTAGQMILKWTFTPSDTLNYKTIVGAMNIIVYADSVQSISVKTNPSKTNYIATEEFDPTGLALTVTYLSGKTADVTYSDENKGDFTFDKTKLAKEDTAVTVTYGEKTATVPVIVTNVVTITQDELNENMPSGIGWTYDDHMGWLKLNSGFEFIVEGECNYDVRNVGTIISGTFNYYVENYGTITGGEFAEVNNYGTIEITNGSVTIDKCTVDTGTVTVDGVKHEHNGNNVTYSEFDYKRHTKVTACEDCPINLEAETIEEHSTTVFTAADNVITAKCVCGEEYGTITLVAPTDLNYTATAKAATVTGEIKGVDTLPEIEYYDMNGNEAEPKNAGTYTAKITIDEATAELEFTIEKVVPEVEVTASSNETLYTSSTTDDVTLTATAINPASGAGVAGTVKFDGAIEFKVGIHYYPVIFTPDDTNYDSVKTTVSLPVAEDTLTGIAVTGTPAKTEYAEGDKFDPTGLTVTAIYASNATKEIEHELLTISPETLAKGDTSAVISYNGKTAEVGGITVRGKLKASDFAFTQPESCVYDKTAKAATVEPFDTVTGIGEITVRYFNGNTELDSAPVNAGTYKVVINVALGENYVAATNISDESWTFTIDKADPVINPKVTRPSTIYDTTDVNSLYLNSGNSDGGKITFDGDITLEVGTKKYPVIFYPLDGNNYNTVKGTVEITVVKDVITNIEVTTQPTKTEYTYGEDFDPKGLVITATYTSGNTETVKYADKPSEFSFTPDELTVATTEVTVTYAEKNDTIEVTVNKAKPSYTAPTNLKVNYGDTLADVVLPSGWSWDAPSTSVGEVGIKTFPATYSVADENYEDVKTNLGVVVSPKTISIGGIVVKNKDYDGTTDATVAAVTFNGVINADTVDYTATGTFADKNAGTGKSVTVKVTVTNKNYILDNDTFTTTATINKADPAVTIPQTASAITGLPLSKAKLPEGWMWNDPAAVPEDGQTYGITYTPEDTANYNTLTAQVTVTVSDCTHPETKDDIKEATCTEDGLKTTICTICEEPTGTEVIPAGHKWNSTYTVDTEATCTTEGEKSIHCKNCPEIKPDSAVTIPAGHKWNETYSSDDTNHWIKCSGCNETKDKGAHQYSYTVGSKQYCSICENIYRAADDEENVVKAPGAGSTHPIHTAPKPTQPQIKGENGKTGWDVISDELALAQDGDTVVVDMNGTTKLPKSVLEDIEGKNIDLVLDMGSGITWTINGETVTNPKAVDLRVSKNVKRIPVNVIDNVTGDNFNMEISLAHNGEFGFEAMLTISLGRKYNDCYANLYYYNPSDKAMEFIDCDLIANGNAQLIFAHASDYAIVIDEEALGDDVSSAAGVTAENETMDTETVSVVFALPLVLAAGFVIRKKLCR